LPTSRSFGDVLKRRSELLGISAQILDSYRIVDVGLFKGSLNFAEHPSDGFNISGDCF
jgi:hypothetical protein